MDFILEEVKISLGLGSSDKDELLKSLINRNSMPILNYIKEKEVPESLEYIVVELVIARYNRIGSEGLNSENSDGVSFSYNNKLLDTYKKDLDEWISDNKAPSTKRVRMRLI